MKLNKVQLKEAVQNRQSIRNYLPIPISKDDQKNIQDYINNPANRIGPNGNAIRLSLLVNDGMFLWSAWANDNAEGFAKMDYNDLFSLEKAGSPIMGEADYPLKALGGLDNTCRLPVGFVPRGSEPGVCFGVSPTAEPIKIVEAPEFMPIVVSCLPPGILINGECIIFN